MSNNNEHKATETKTDIDQKALEQKWQDYWETEKLYHFDFNSDKPVYSIDNPPRYASGPLHVGHAVHYTHIDFAARYKRMKGFNVFFPLCFDVNGMPIEVNVEKKYNIKMVEYDRQEFIKLCREFAKANIGEMTRQFKILGECMDPSIYYQTDAEYYRRLTQLSFIKLFQNDIIYKGERPINWCPRCGTALADAEVEYRDRTTKFNYIKFKLSESGEDIVIATTRPELLCTCHMVALNPDDTRADELAGKLIKTPLYEKEVRILPDDAVKPEFGTGIVMVCSIGDKDDLEWIARYDLPFEKGIDQQGKMTEVAGKYFGMEIMDARQAIIQDLKDADLLVKQESLDQEVGSCWRCHTPIEFLVTPQWFLKTLEFKSEVLRIADEIDWYPEYMKTRLIEWVNSLSWDWVISRQRYFATPIPLWECEECQHVVLANEEMCYVDPTIDPAPVDKCPECGNANLKGCSDVFDTWMDSSISPLFNSFWERDNDNFNKLFPMSMRPQSHDIIRTWAFYTILRSHLLCDIKPWSEIMMGGFILAPDGTPMHASRNNVIDPLGILDKYGADAIRYYAAHCALGKDNAFRWKDVTEGVRFTRKLWNVEKLMCKNFKDRRPEQMDINEVKDKLHDIDKWILTIYSELVESSTEFMNNFQFDKSRKIVVEFIWHELADHYLELVKHRIYNQSDEDKTIDYILYTIGFGIIKLIAPLLPHITEEIYQQYYRDIDGAKSIHVTTWPKPVLLDKAGEEDGKLIKDFIRSVRHWKSEQGIPLNGELSYIGVISGDKNQTISKNKEDIISTIKAKSFEVIDDAELEVKAKAIKPVYSTLGPEFKGASKEIISKLEQQIPESILENLSVQGNISLELDSGEHVTLTEKHIFVETSKQIHGREVETLDLNGDVTILIEK
jgi:valyl-tRNA synthetase